jgi:hypothetical protein
MVRRVLDEVRVKGGSALNSGYSYFHKKAVEIS